MTHGCGIAIQAGLWCLLLASAPNTTSQQPSTSNQRQGRHILGVLEDFPGEYSGESDFRAVRAVFKKVGDSWQPFPTKTKTYHDLETLPTSYPKELTWTIVFDGKSLGIVSSQTPAHFRFYSEIGIEQVTSHGPVPTVGKRSRDYGGFAGDPVYRPLVAVSTPNFSDPDQWKPAPLSANLIATARARFQKKFPKVSNCRNPDENVMRPWKYGDKNVRVIKTYSSKRGWSLIDLSLTGYACDGPYDGTGFIGQWYVVDPSGETRFLGTDMWLVDAGDYDNSGRSAVLFSIDGYNTGGYRLFYSDFSKSAEFLFNYH